MATTFKLWKDASMTQVFDHTGSDAIESDTNGDFTVWIGSNDATKKMEVTADPGVDDILLTPTDNDPGNGHEASEIKLATSQLGLDSAGAGSALNLGPTITGGSAIAIWIRLTDSTGGGVQSLNELSCQFNPCSEYTI